MIDLSGGGRPEILAGRGLAGLGKVLVDYAVLLIHCPRR